MKNVTEKKVAKLASKLGRKLSRKTLIDLFTVLGFNRMNDVLVREIASVLQEQEDAMERKKSDKLADKFERDAAHMKRAVVHRGR